METIEDNVFVETVYPGVNIGCVITDAGTLCVDTPLLPGEAQRWRARIRSLGGEPVRFVVYTSGQRERILGTQYLLDLPEPSHIQVSRRGLGLLTRPERTTPSTERRDVDRGELVLRGAVLAHRAAWSQVKEHRTDGFKQSMIDMLGERAPAIKNLRVIPPHITCDTHFQLYLGDETATLRGVATGLVWVWLPTQRVLFTGDTLVVGTHPPLNLTDVDEWLAALQILLKERQFKDAVIVPGRGSLCDVSAAKPLMNYLKLARDKTLKTLQAGRPKTDLNSIAARLVELYPVADGQWERVQRQIKVGLDEMYDAFKAAGATAA